MHILRETPEIKFQHLKPKELLIDESPAEIPTCFTKVTLQNGKAIKERKRRDREKESEEKLPSPSFLS